MSDNVLSYGYMAILVTPVGDHHTETWEELSDKLQEETDLSLNYDGTVVYSDQCLDTDSDAMFSLVMETPEMRDEFMDAITAYGIEIISEPRFYSCVWYNGSDSPMSEIHTKQLV